MGISEKLPYFCAAHLSNTTMHRTLLVLSAAFAVNFSTAQLDTSVTDTSKFVPLITLSSDDLDSDNDQDVSTLLQSSRDVFVQAAGFNFSAARFRMRGYNSNMFTVMMNNVVMNDPEYGRAIWAYWGGLNDITRYPQIKNGISASEKTFGSLGGWSNISLRASDMRAGSRASYAATNRTYNNRVMLTHNTGMMKNGWAFSVSGGFRWSQEGYVDGTYFNGGSYFLSAEKKLNDKHSIGIAGFAAPTIQARSGIALQETYDLTGDNYYNPYWGWQTQADGSRVKRNARVRDNHRPSVFLSDYWTIDETSKLTSTIYGTFGKTGSTNLNWYDAKDPRPDYYRYLPSYYTLTNPGEANYLTNAWANDQLVSQINWDGLYQANYNNIYELENANGTGETLIGLRSKYIVEELRQDPVQFGYNAVYSKQLKEDLQLSAGANIDFYTSHNYKKIKDLMGGDFWVDVDQFAEQDFADPTIGQNDLEVANKVVYEGDKVGYNYDIHVNTQNVFGQIEGKSAKVDWYGGIELSYTSFWRDGIWANGRFPDNSQGKGEVHSFFNYGVKVGAVYKISGRHYITGNLMYKTQAPFSSNAYVSPRTRDGVVGDLESTEILSGDLNYEVRYPNFKARATVFYSEINNQTWARSYYHDEFRTFINYAMTGMDFLNMGTEIGFDATVASVIQITGAFTTGDYIYNSRPTATITRDNSSEVIADDRTIYLQNYKQGGMPQTAFNLGVKYNSPKYWYVGINANYFTDIYLAPSPDRRTEEAVNKYTVDDPQWDAILAQTELEDGFVMNAFVGKSWKIKERFIRVNLNINNVLNTTTFRTGGYEQLRFDSNDIDKFPPKYGYMYGLNYFAMISYLF